LDHRFVDKQLTFSLKTPPLKTKDFRDYDAKEASSRKSKFSEHQIIAILNAVEAGRTVT
jgi:hypothetical protein